MKRTTILSLVAAAVLPAVSSAQVYLTLSTGQFGTVDVHSGAFNAIGYQTNAAGATVLMGDIAYNAADGKVYGNTYSSTNAELVTISTGNAAISTIGATLYSNSLEFLNYGVLATHDATGADIHAIDPSTGATTDTRTFFGAADAGKVAFDLVSAPNNSVAIYAIDSANLYYWGNNGTDAVLVGNTGFSSVYGLAWWDSILWGFGFDGRGKASVFSIDLATGAGTFSAYLNGGDFNQGAYTFGATSTGGAVPEPSTYATIGALALGFLAAGRRLRARRNA